MMAGPDKRVAGARRRRFRLLIMERYHRWANGACELLQLYCAAQVRASLHPKDWPLLWPPRSSQQQRRCFSRSRSCQPRPARLFSVRQQRSWQRA